MQRHGKVLWLTPEQTGAVGLALESVSLAPRDRAAMLDDAHLVRAAICTDKIIISLDDAAKGLFARASANLSELRRIMWASPVGMSDTPSWLSRGAPTDQMRMLSSYVPDAG